MKIIALEGLDKSGKHSASNTIIDFLEKQGFSVRKAEFHNYDSPTGKLIMDYLKGDYHADDLTIELLMAADKQAMQDTFTRYEEEGIDFLILDRYLVSQYAYAKAKGVNELHLQSICNSIRRPTHNILLDVTAEESMSRKGKHNDGENDLYESNHSLLKSVRYAYQSMIPKEFTVDAMQPIENVHTDLIDLVERKILRRK